MIRVLTGRGWRFNPKLLEELRDGRARSTGTIMDVLGVEVDGIDLFAGLSEDRVIEVTSDLATAASRLASGYSRAQVACSGGDVELLFERRDRRALLTLVRVRRPSAVLVDNLELELSALTSAILRSGAGLLEDLRKIHPPLLEQAPVQHLRRALAGALGRPPRAASRVPPVAGPLRALKIQGHVGEASFRIAVDDALGRFESFAGGRADLLSLLAPGTVTVDPGNKLPPWSSTAPPFLVLRDLVQSGLEALRALEQGDTEHEVPLDGSALLLLRMGDSRSSDLASATGAFARQTSRGAAIGEPGFRPCSPASLLSTFFEAASAFGGMAIRQNGRQNQNSPLVMLLAEAREGLARSRELAATQKLDSTPAERLPRSRSPLAAEPRLGPGKLKLLSYREAWKRPGPPVRRLALARQSVIVEREKGVQCLAVKTGAVQWAVDVRQATFAQGRRAALFLADTLGLSRRTVDGDVLWQTPLPSTLPRLACISDGAVDVIAASDGQAISAFSASQGTALWRFAPPSPGRLGLMAVRGRLLLWTRDERLYCVSPLLGQLLWRSRGRPISEAAMVGDRIVVHGKSCGFDILNLRTGKYDSPSAVVLDRAGAAVPIGRSLLALAGIESGQGCVLALQRNGEVAWKWTDEERSDGKSENATSGSAMPMICACPGGLLVRGARALCFLNAEGTVRWSHPLSSQTHDWIAPVERRGIAFTSGESGLFALDVETGNVLGELALEAPLTALVVDRQLNIYAAVEAGPVRAFHIQRFLSVV